jgi:hypothetical protein
VVSRVSRFRSCVREAYVCDAMAGKNAFCADCHETERNLAINGTSAIYRKDRAIAAERADQPVGRPASPRARWRAKAGRSSPP